MAHIYPLVHLWLCEQTSYTDCMNGIRHEQAVLVVMAYIVGFVTAFIAFGISESNKALPLTNYKTDNHISANQVAEAADADVVEVTHSDNKVSYEDGMLQVHNVYDNPIVLSVDVSLMPELAEDPQFSDQGVHQSLTQYGVSQDGNYVYFCEQMVQPDTCRSFVYDITEDLITPLTFSGDGAEIAVADAATARWSNGVLQIAEYTSEYQSGMWDMTIN